MAIEKKKLHVKKGDNVVVITGKDAGKKGKIINVDTKAGRVYVDKVNVVSRHTKPTPGAPQGGIVKKEASIDSSNVMLFCSKCGSGEGQNHRQAQQDAENACDFLHLVSS